MGASSRGILVALLCASFALTTAASVVAERIYDRDLEIRQANATVCPDSYTSNNGLNFTTYCEQNNPFNDAYPVFPTRDMYECFERCSRYWGSGEGCFGIVFVQNGNQCWIRNSTTSTAGLIPKAGHYSALITPGELQGVSTTCPNSDLSVNSLSDVPGIQYTTHCGKSIQNQDACFSGVPTCFGSPFYGYYHTNSLEACLRICVNEHPLCRAVVWNPDLHIGFANCWLKTGFDQLVDPGVNMGVLHAATITQFERIDSTCPATKTYSAPNRVSFELHCGQLNTGTNITSFHAQNITSCMNACSTSDKQCIGIVFDSTLQNGYNNCYLQNTTSVISDKASATYAALVGSPIPSSSSSPSPGAGSNSGSSGGGSKAWIAGPVIGGIAALLIIGAAVWWWRRRKAAGAGEKHDAQYGPAPAYSPGGHSAQAYYDNTPPREMDARATSELPASMKYAHTAKGPVTTGAGAGAPHELAS